MNEKTRKKIKKNFKMFFQRIIRLHQIKIKTKTA